MDRRAHSRPIPPAPAAFEGSLSTLFEEYIAPVLPHPDVVLHFHDLLAACVRRPDPLFVVRHVAGLERGTVVKTDGGRLRPSDNSPAWMIHRLLFDQYSFGDVDGLEALLAGPLPCHFHDMAGIPTVNSAGWHVAHIFPAKDGETDYRRWTQQDLTRRFVRNLHPCNCFFVPKQNWRRHGGDPDVLAFAASVHRQRYGRAWQGFLDLASVSDLGPPRVAPQDLRLAYRPSSSIAYVPAADPSGCADVEYSATRLLFRRDLIGTLAPHQRFRVVTRDHGTFEFTREDFERVFSSILATESWKRAGLYHMPTPPRKAMPFLVRPLVDEGEDE